MTQMTQTAIIMRTLVNREEALMKDVTVYIFTLLVIFLIIGLLLNVCLKRPLKEIIDDFLSFIIPW